MIYSRRDHLKWGWNGQNFNDPIPGGTFELEVGSVPPIPRSMTPTTPPRTFNFQHEVITAAQCIADSLTKPLMIGLSGGIDSQVACLAFKAIKYPFIPVVTRYVDRDGVSCNEHDISTAFEFCKKFGLTPTVDELDIYSYFDTPKFVNRFEEHGPLMGAMAVHLESVDKYAAKRSYLVAGEIVLTKVPDRDELFLVEQVPIQQHMIKRGYEAIDLFFHYSPELMLAYLEHPVVRGFRNAHKMVCPAFQAARPAKGWWNQFALYYKPLVYVEAFPDLVQVRKWSGFEFIPQVEAEIEKAKAKIQRFDPERNKVLIPVEELVEHLRFGQGAGKRWSS